jgi:hypothetical protein
MERLWTRRQAETYLQELADLIAPVKKAAAEGRRSIR